MPLPTLPFTVSETTFYETTVRPETYGEMLQAVHEGVLELGLGKCLVLSQDNPRTLTFGFRLAEIGVPVADARQWEFEIGISRVSAVGGLSGEERRRLGTILQTATGRAEIARQLQAGVPADKVGVGSSFTPS